MKSPLSFALILSLVASTWPVAAQESAAVGWLAVAPDEMSVNEPVFPADLSLTAGEASTGIGSDMTDIRLVTNLRAELEAYRQARAIVSLGLTDGSRVTGSVDRPRTDRFELVTYTNHQVVPYEQIASFRDPATGRVMAVVQQRGIGGIRGPSAKTTLIVIAIIGAVLLIVGTSFRD